MDWDKAFEEQAREMARRNDSVSQARLDVKSASEHERGVRNGWHDMDGNSLIHSDEDADEDGGAVTDD